MKVAFSGERGAFGELAAIEYFGPRQTFTGLPEFTDVFRSVVDGESRYGVVPIENSLAGSIHQNYDLLLESDLRIVGEVLLRIRHFLIGNRGASRARTSQVFSHPQALAQCKKFLKKMPGVTVVPFSNTAAAVKKIRDEKLTDAAAIGSMQAAIDFNMKVLARNIEDNQWNTTRFLVLSKTQERRRGAANARMKTSIVFSTKNIPGALFKCLSVFALRDIDLYKIESRPVHAKGFAYLFYLDFAGDARSERQRNAINHLQEITTFYRLLGSYPVGKLAHPEYHPRAVGRR